MPQPCMGDPQNPAKEYPVIPLATRSGWSTLWLPAQHGVSQSHQATSLLLPSLLHCLNWAWNSPVAIACLRRKHPIHPGLGSKIQNGSPSLCECLHFSEVFRFSFKKPGHINVNETRTYKSWLKSMAKTQRDKRFIGILDSRVTLGAAAKGRSSSFAISRVLQGSIGYLIGGNLYPGGLHCYSAHNRADEPSRQRPVRGPTKDEPSWLTDLRAGKPAKFDAVIASSRITKNPARWPCQVAFLRFLLLLAGDIEENPGPANAPTCPFEK